MWRISTMSVRSIFVTMQAREWAMKTSIPKKFPAFMVCIRSVELMDAKKAFAHPGSSSTCEKRKLWFRIILALFKPANLPDVSFERGLVVLTRMLLHNFQKGE